MKIAFSVNRAEDEPGPPLLVQVVLLVLLIAGGYKGYRAWQTYWHTPKEFHVHVGGSYKVPFEMDVLITGQPKRSYTYKIPRDLTFKAEGPAHITVNARRPSGLAHGVVELTLTKPGSDLHQFAASTADQPSVSVQGS